MHVQYESHAGFMVWHAAPTANPTKKAVLFLPGFPGVLSGRNEDLAERLARAHALDVFVLQYPGLGKNSGESFSFGSAEAAAQASLSWLSSRYDQVSIVGHSFGGALAILYFRNLHKKLDKLVLMSPLLELPQAALDSIIHGIYVDEPSLFSGISEAQLLSDARRFCQSLRFDSLNEDSFGPGQTYFIQAIRDEETPLEVARKLKHVFGPELQYEELDADHSFIENRALIYDRIESALTKSVLE